MKQCQSCAMPFSKDPQGGGTEIDGSLSDKWCSFCYENGLFKRECSLDEMKEFVDRQMQEQKMNRMMRKMTMWQLGRLDRWK